MGDEVHRDTAPAVSAVLEHVDEAKRSSLRRIVIGTAYAMPAIASFTLTGLSSTEANAYIAK